MIFNYMRKNFLFGGLVNVDGSTGLSCKQINVDNENQERIEYIYRCTRL